MSEPITKPPEGDKTAPPEQATLPVPAGASAEPKQSAQAPQTPTQKVEVSINAPSTSQEVTPHGSTSGTPIFVVILMAALLSYIIHRLNRHPLVSPVRRWMPIVQIVVWAVALILVGALTLARLDIEWFYFELVLLALLCIVNISWLRSVIAGAALTMEGRLSKGDDIRVGDLDGEIVGFGLRAIHIRANDGTLHHIPNHLLLSEATSNVSGDNGDSACEIIVTVPEHIDTHEAMSLAQQAAMLSPLASPRHRPEVFIHALRTASSEPTLRIKGYAFDATYREHFRSDVTERVMHFFDERVSPA